METQDLKVELRTPAGKGGARAVRRSGLIPGVCYGHGLEPFGVSMEPKELDRIMHSAKGRNSVIALQADGKTHQVMIADAQRDPVRRDVTHVDFRSVEPQDVVVVEVPVKAVGAAPGVKLGGRLEMVRRTVTLRCQVKDIPESIEYDVSALGLGDKVLASQITPPEACELSLKSDFLVIRIVVPRGAAANAAAAAAGGE